MAPRTAGARRARNNAPKGYFWRGLFLLIFGFTCGVGSAAYLAAYVNKLPLPFITPPTRDTLPENGQSGTKRETLEFHDVLRQQQQVAPIVEEETPTTVPRKFVYYLQMGAFDNKNTAEQLRGEIALLGRQTSINPGRTAAGGTIFRVWIGPYDSENTAEETRAQLVLQGYNSVQLLKLVNNEN